MDSRGRSSNFESKSQYREAKKYDGAIIVSVMQSTRKNCLFAIERDFAGKVKQKQLTYIGHGYMQIDDSFIPELASGMRTKLSKNVSKRDKERESKTEKHEKKFHSGLYQKM